MYNSIHQYINGVTAEERQFHFIGNEQGKGFNINITMDEVRIFEDSNHFLIYQLQECFGESEYMATFLNILLPVGYEVRLS